MAGITRLISLISLLVPSTALFQSSNSLRCFDCKYLPNPSFCSKITHCSNGEICAVEKTISRDGQVVYNSGCQSIQMCSAMPLVGRKRSDSCQVCCDRDFCNDRCDNANTSNSQTLSPTTTPVFTATAGKLTWPPQRTLTTSTIQTKTFTPTSTTFTTATQMTTPTASTTSTTAATTTSTMTSTQEATTTAYRATKPQRSTTVNVTTHTTTPIGVAAQTNITNVKMSGSTHGETQTSTPATQHHVQTTLNHNVYTTTSLSDQRDLCHEKHYHYDRSSHLCYKIHHEEQTWHQANTTCGHEGGTLAILDTQAKWDAMKAQIEKDSKLHQPIYIGGHAVNHDGPYTWANGMPVVYNSWAHNQPGEGGLRKCMFLNFNHQYLWYNRICSHNYAFICTIYFQ